MPEACRACGREIGAGEKYLRFEDAGESISFRLKPHGCALKNPSKYPENRSPAFRRKWESLVLKLKKRGDVDNAFAVATAALGGYPPRPRRNPSTKLVALSKRGADFQGPGDTVPVDGHVRIEGNRIAVDLFESGIETPEEAHIASESFPLTTKGTHDAEHWIKDNSAARVRLVRANKGTVITSKTRRVKPFKHKAPENVIVKADESVEGPLVRPGKNPSRVRAALGRAKKHLTSKRAKRIGRDIAAGAVAAGGIAASPEVGPEAGVAGIAAAKAIRGNPVQEVDGPMADELFLGIINDRALYSRQTEPIIKNLRRKVEKGTYDAKKAPLLWRHLVDSKVREYAKEANIDSRLINGATRNEVVHDLMGHYSSEVQAGKKNPESIASWIVHRFAELKAKGLTEKEAKDLAMKEGFDRYYAKDVRLFLRREARKNPVLTVEEAEAKWREEEGSPEDSARSYGPAWRRYREAKILEWTTEGVGDEEDGPHENPSPKEAERSLCQAFKELSKGRLGAGIARDYAERALRQSGGEGEVATAATRLLAALDVYYTAAPSLLVPDPMSVLRVMAAKNPVVNGATVTRIEYTTGAGERFFHNFTEDPKFPQPSIRVKKGARHDKLVIGPTTVRAAGIGAGQ